MMNNRITDIKFLNKELQSEMISINPHICKNCKFAWLLTTEEIKFKDSKNNEYSTFYYALDCVNDKIIEFGGKHPVINNLYYQNELNIQKDINELKKTNIHHYSFLYDQKSTKQVIHPVDITDDIINICKNILTSKKCPCYIEHSISEWSNK